MSGKLTQIDLDEDTQIDVQCQIHQLSFSPHTDAKGIMDLGKFLSPKHAILVHGEKPKMATLKERIQSKLGIQCYCPANNETVTIPSTHYVKADASGTFIRSYLNPRLSPSDERVTEGILVVEKAKEQRLYNRMSFCTCWEKKKHEIQFAYCFLMHMTRTEDLSSASHLLCGLDKCTLISRLSTILSNELSEGNILDLGKELQVESFRVSI